ncbi:hypothetical protein KSS93_19285 [Pseudomonas xanthosomatis]|uniref:hypothetical protein n=1 Tax=Pseudomonas xanthosomatis TaxID=2842356 RepID=UPI001C3D43D1|nr:hypothetical protein [Pseudomonas xanthosomatis]QXH45016.1 hypothetical protein KSS93_19285 [Pseudomonas xanthosomatis]
MQRVFISGSITLKRLGPQVEARLDNIRTSQLQVLVGDASGVDSAVQRYFKSHSYDAVRLYCSGPAPRHNIGGWPQVNVVPPANARGRALYTAKDLRMAEDCDFGLMVWDCKSPGTLSNVIELLRRNKKSVVYLQPEDAFLTISSADDLHALLDHMAPGARQEADKKIALSKKLAQLASPTDDGDDPRQLQAQIDHHRARIARHQQQIDELQARLARLAPVDDLFPN